MTTKESAELPLKPYVEGDSHAEDKEVAEATEPSSKDFGTAQNDDGEETTGSHGIVATNPADLPASKKKKRKKRKPASKRGIGAPTGMETFYADAPMTPEEQEEEQQIYHEDIPFIDRILTAMQRFERTRRLSPERRDVFYKWLHYGGIKVGPSAFSSGIDQENMDKSEIATALSRIQVPDDLRSDLESADSDDPKYAIDFLGCMRAFLSYRAPNIYYFAKKDDVELVTTTLERFMDYLLQHNVCTEHDDEVLATRNFCRKAVEGLWATSEAQRWLPGDFNMACSTLFGGNYGKIYDGKTYWGELPPGESAFVGFTPEQATQIVGLGIAGAASEDVYSQYAEFFDVEDGAGLDVVKTINGAGFEIVHVEHATAECKELYKNNSSEYRPVGRVIARAWRNPLSPPEDLRADERDGAQTPPTSEPYIFFVEEIVLQNLSMGQKILATIRKLNCGVWFFDEFVTIYPDFELWTPNDMVEDYKLPRMLPGAYAPGAAGILDIENREQELDEEAEMSEGEGEPQNSQQNGDYSTISEGIDENKNHSSLDGAY